ncbi:MAG: pyridoxal kinase PdxY [Pseudomonadota bacterium]
MKSKAPVLVITSHVVRGRIGQRAAVFALERLGHPCWVLPTVVLPWHPGHGKAHRQVADNETFASLVDDLSAAPWLDEIGAVLTGYLANPAQAAPIAKLIDQVKNRRPDLLYCCDPVIGDHSGLYVADETAQAIRDVLVPRADLITPNRFEFDYLTGQTHGTNEAIIESARGLSANRVAVTSAFSLMKDASAALIFDKQTREAFLAEHRAFQNAPNGPGDLFAALLTARLLEDRPIEKALELATSGVFDILAQTVKEGADELLLVEHQDRLNRPMAMVNVRRLVGGAVTRKGAVVRPSPLV